MKKLLFAIIALFTFSTVAMAQIERPVKWAYSAKKIGKGEAVIYLKATIDKGWYIYSQNIPDGGPVKTSFNFNPSADYTLVGKTVEPTPASKYEDSFKMNVKYFQNSVIFTQKVKLKKATTNIKGTLEFMVCNSIKCLPPDEVEFNIPVK